MVTKETTHLAPTGRLGWLSRVRPSFAATITAAVGVGLLLFSVQAVVAARSLKYLIAMIIAALVWALLLLLKGKPSVLLFIVGLSLPLYAEIILIKSSDNLTLTVTFLTALLLAAASLLTGSISWKGFDLIPTITLPSIMFLCAGCLSMVSTTERTGTLLAIAQEGEMVVLFLILSNAIRNEKHLSFFLKGLYISLAIECVVLVIENITGVSFDIVGNSRYYGSTDLEAGALRFQRGTLGAGPIILGMYFGVMTLSLIGAYLCNRKLRVGLNPLVGLLMGGGSLVLAAKRSPWGGFALGIAVMLGLLLRYSHSALRRLLKVMAVMVVPMIILFPIISLRVQAQHESDYEERVNLTRIAWQMFDAHPWTGVGLGSYDAVKREYLPEDWMGWVYKVHNRYLLILAETGIVGEACLLMVYAMILYQALVGIPRMNPDYRPLQIGIVAALVAVYWQMIWEICDNRQANYIHWFLASLAIIVPRVFAREASSVELAFAGGTTGSGRSPSLDVKERHAFRR